MSHPLNDPELRRLFDHWASLAGQENSPTWQELEKARFAFIERTHELLERVVEAARGGASGIESEIESLRTAVRKQLTPNLIERWQAAWVECQLSGVPRTPSYMAICREVRTLVGVGPAPFAAARREALGDFIKEWFAARQVKEMSRL